MLILPPTIAPRTRPEISSFVIANIEAEGVRVPPSSRLRRMHDLYHSGMGSIDTHHPDYEIAIEGDRDMQLLAFAFDQLANTEVSSEYRMLLRKLITDSVLPQADRSNSPGRDAAFEILIAAICTAAKLLPVTLEEPDVSCVLDGTKYALAAKRIKNFQNLGKRVRKAVEQIDRSGCPGVIVLDLGLALNRDNARIRNMPEADFVREYQENFHVTWSEHQPKVQEIIGRADVLGIIVHDYHILQRDTGWQLAGMTVQVAAEHRCTVDRERFERLSTLYKFGLPNQTAC